MRGQREGTAGERAEEQRIALQGKGKPDMLPRANTHLTPSAARMALTARL